MGLWAETCVCDGTAGHAWQEATHRHGLQVRDEDETVIQHFKRKDKSYVTTA